MSDEDRLSTRFQTAMEILDRSVEVDNDVMGGVPVLKGTRLTIARILAEVSAGLSIREIADEFEIEETSIKEFFSRLSGYLNRPFTPTRS